MKLETPKRPSVGTMASGLPRVRWLLIIGLVVVTMLAFTGAPANAADHRCGVISAAKWTEQRGSGNHWVVSAYHVGCGFAETWARRLTRAKLLDRGVWATHPIFERGTDFPAHFECEIHRIFNAHPYSEGTCIHQPATSNEPNFAWGIKP